MHQSRSGSSRERRCVGDKETTAPASSSGIMVTMLAMSSADCWAGVSLSADLSRISDGVTLPLRARFVAKSLSAEMTAASFPCATRR